jgi:hypothetical protein
VDNVGFLTSHKPVDSETKEYTVLETVTRQPLVKAQQTDKILTCCSDLFRSRRSRLRPKDPSRLPRDTLYPQKLAPASPTSGGRCVGVVRSRAEATDFSLV